MTTQNKAWYEQLFSNFANQYENEDFTKGTVGEVTFIEEEIFRDKNSLILDVGCGTGRHAIELAKRGYSVEGFDLSENQIAKAKTNSSNAGVNVRFFTADARSFNFNEKYDYAIMMCEGAFPLMETDEMNAAIMQNIFHSIKSGGKLVFTCLNGLFPLLHSIKEFTNNGSNCISDKNSFDLMTFRDHSEYTFTDDDNQEQTIICNERYYVPSEISWLMKTCGFSNVEIYGAHLGNLSRNHKLTTEDFEMLVIATK